MPARPPVHRPPGMKSKQQRMREFDKARGSSTQRGYDSVWQRLRVAFLKVNPTCTATLPSTQKVCGAAATDVDHVLSPKTHPQLRLALGNLRPRCHGCHSRRTAKDQGFANPSLRHYTF
jgi:5-methylcytosine-specific restriction enzyme A